MLLIQTVFSIRVQIWIVLFQPFICMVFCVISYALPCVVLSEKLLHDLRLPWSQLISPL